MNTPALLQARHLTLITRASDSELARIHDLVAHKLLVDGRCELEVVLGTLLGHAAKSPGGVLAGQRTLDLVGHSTPGKSLLMLGDWVIDTQSATVTAFFRELAELDVLPRLGVTAVRLLGCETATTRHGRATICTLSDILGIEVFGTRTLIYAAHYDRDGFSDDAEHALVSASDLVRDAMQSPHHDRMARYERVLDVDGLPAIALEQPCPWPRRVATAHAARTLLACVRRTGGVQMDGLLTAPSCEVVLPSNLAGHYHLVQVLLDGELVRVYPDGTGAAGVVYAVEDPHALRAIVERLPPVA